MQRRSAVIQTFDGIINRVPQDSVVPLCQFFIPRGFPAFENYIMSYTVDMQKLEPKIGQDEQNIVFRERRKEKKEENKFTYSWRHYYDIKTMIYFVPQPTKLRL
ncbi:hypothetical protein QE152_g31247 [Popillia japonica]|uniref:Uncharacterized protein n=1 Tax=Popillia japonica TaxID=7064 RepID=A0AAW1JC43_POPJA